VSLGEKLLEGLDGFDWTAELATALANVEK
jgi:hypothetical protein